jgi:hypothetical protein
MCMLIVQGGFALAFQMCTSCFNQINPPLLFFTALPCSPVIQQLTVQCVIFTHMCNVLYT